jgi:hypothetical protein
MSCSRVAPALGRLFSMNSMLTSFNFLMGHISTTDSRQGPREMTLSEVLFAQIVLTRDPSDEC